METRYSEYYVVGRGTECDFVCFEASFLGSAGWVLNGTRFGGEGGSKAWFSLLLFFFSLLLSYLDCLLGVTSE